MCNLDIIAEPVTEEQLWNRWFFNSLEDADFVVTLVVFGAVFVMLVSVLALFAVMLLKNFRKKAPESSVEADGSIHAVPFLCSVAGTIMVAIAVFCLVALLFATQPWLYRYLPYHIVLPYAAVSTVLFIIALAFSPRASKLFKIWNKVCLIPCVLAITVSLFFYVFYWFTLIV